MITQIFYCTPYGRIGREEPRIAAPHGRTSRASLQFMDHFVGIDAKEQRNCTQLFALLNFNP